MSFSCPGSTNINPIVRKVIRNVKGFNPNPTPVISSLSTYSSVVDQYTTVFINGLNFFPFGSTTVTFGDIKNIPISYFSSVNISFTLPIINTATLPAGVYEVVVVTVNDRTQILPTCIYSNKVQYTLNNPTPIISSLYSHSPIFDQYATIFVNGQHFMPFGITTVTFGDYTNIPIRYLSPVNISFMLPLDGDNPLNPGPYEVVVVTAGDKTRTLPYLYSNKAQFTLTFRS